MKSGVTWIRLRRSESRAEPSRVTCRAAPVVAAAAAAVVIFLLPLEIKTAGSETLSWGSAASSAAQQKCQVGKKWVNILILLSDASLHLARLQVGRRRCVRAHGRAAFSGVTNSSIGCASWVPAGGAQAPPTATVRCGAARWDEVRCGAVRCVTMRCGAEGSAAVRMRLEHRVVGQWTPEPDPTAFTGNRHSKFSRRSVCCETLRPPKQLQMFHTLSLQLVEVGHKCFLNQESHFLILLWIKRCEVK